MYALKTAAELASGRTFTRNAADGKYDQKHSLQAGDVFTAYNGMTVEWATPTLKAAHPGGRAGLYGEQAEALAYN
jgi:hypothetical protein